MGSQSNWDMWLEVFDLTLTQVARGVEVSLEDTQHTFFDLYGAACLHEKSDLFANELVDNPLLSFFSGPSVHAPGTEALSKAWGQLQSGGTLLETLSTVHRCRQQFLIDIDRGLWADRLVDRVNISSLVSKITEWSLPICPIVKGLGSMIDIDLPIGKGTAYIGNVNKDHLEFKRGRDQKPIKVSNLTGLDPERRANLLFHHDEIYADAFAELQWSAENDSFFADLTKARTLLDEREFCSLPVRLDYTIQKYNVASMVDVEMGSLFPREILDPVWQAVNLIQVSD